MNIKYESKTKEKGLEDSNPRLERASADLRGSRGARAYTTSKYFFFPPLSPREFQPGAPAC